MDGKWSYYGGGQFKGGDNSHSMEVGQFREGECTCYGGGQFNGGRMVMLQRWPV